MCRWLAYSGSPLLLDDLLYKPTHSLIDQSLHSELGVKALVDQRVSGPVEQVVKQ